MIITAALNGKAVSRGGLFHEGTVAGQWTGSRYSGLSTGKCAPQDGSAAHICNHASIVGVCERGGGQAATAAHEQGRKEDGQNPHTPDPAVTDYQGVP
ncbi:hypothetical protein [Azospirillum melinis]